MSSNKIIISLAVVLAGSMAFVRAGKNAKPQALDMGAFFEKKLGNLSILTAEKIKEIGLSRTYPEADFETAWDCLVKVVIQNGIIVYADKKSGRLIAVSDFLTKGPDESQADLIKEPSPLCNTIYVCADPVDAITTAVYLKADKPLNRVFFDKLSTQLYAGKKLKFLRTLSGK